jgi:hypothetical protein
MSYETVKAIWQHWCKHGQIEPKYEQARVRGTRVYGVVYEAAVGMKQDHRRWGARLIALKLKQSGAYEKTPHARTLQRWFGSAGLSGVRQS